MIQYKARHVSPALSDIPSVIKAMLLDNRVSLFISRMLNPKEASTCERVDGPLGLRFTAFGSTDSSLEMNKLLGQVQEQLKAAPFMRSATLLNSEARRWHSFFRSERVSVDTHS